MDEKTLLQSKKAGLSIVGVLACIVVGAAAVAWGGPLGIQALPSIITGIVTITGTGVLSQGAQDGISAYKDKAKDPNNEAK